MCSCDLWQRNKFTANYVNALQNDASFDALPHFNCIIRHWARIERRKIDHLKVVKHTEIGSLHQKIIICYRFTSRYLCWCGHLWMRSCGNSFAKETANGMKKAWFQEQINEAVISARWFLFSLSLSSPSILSRCFCLSNVSIPLHSLIGLVNQKKLFLFSFKNGLFLFGRMCCCFVCARIWLWQG